MSDFVKPTVFNPRQAMDRINELEATIKRQSDNCMKLREENTDLRIEIDKLRQIQQITETQQETISKYEQIFKLQEAELKALRGDKA